MEILFKKATQGIIQNYTTRKIDNMMCNKSPTLKEPWDSRFTDRVCERRHKKFRTKYLARVEPVLVQESNRLQALKDNAVSVVSVNRRLFADINDDILKNGATDEKFEVVISLYKQLAESEAMEVATDDRFEAYQSYMEETRSGSNDPEHMEWNRTKERVDKSNRTWKADFTGELNKRIESKPDAWWDDFRNGSNRKSKGLAIEICHLLAYFDQYLTEARLSIIFKVAPNNHNTKLALEKLMEVRVVESTTDEEGDTVFGFVDTLQLHLQYESNLAVDDRVKADLKRLYNEGHDTINARREKELGKNRVAEQKSDNEDTEHDDNGTQNGNYKGNGDKDDLSLDSEDENERAEQQSTSKEEEAENVRKEDEDYDREDEEEDEEVYQSLIEV